MAEGLGGLWRLAAAFRVLPLPLRDALYGWVARNRLKWFGRHEVCWLAEPGQEARFLG
jgi:predicted DCC family thiol-disulfide oxidoreductase YuxK